MSMESFNACVYLVDRQVQAGLGGHLAITGPAGSLTYDSVGATAVLDPARATPAGAAERLAADRPTLFFAGPAFFAALLTADAPVVRKVVARQLGKPGE
jgi:hypothetical protein